jgi:hypothetical protein
VCRHFEPQRHPVFDTRCCRELKGCGVGAKSRLPVADGYL